MGKYCPGCGSEVKKGSKFCQSCGAQINTNSISSTFEDQVAQPLSQQTPPPKIPKQTPITPPQQQIGQTQAYAPVSPRKSNMNLIIALIAIIVLVIIIIIVVFLLLGGGDGRFVGRWEQEGSNEYGRIIWNFKSDGSLDLITEIMGQSTTTDMGSWEVRDNQLCTGITEYATNCVSFEFSKNENTLTLSYSDDFDSDNIVLNKI